jgi:two-component system, LuxR family, sensor kinase FixL
VQKALIRPLAASVVVGGLIFAFDLALPLGVAGGVPYITLVMLGTWYPRESHFYVLATVSTILVILGFFLSAQGAALWVVLINRFLALFVIWITAWQLVSRRRAEHELREKEQELRRVSRMSDMGLMASALAHEINQPLSAISNYVQAARRTLELSKDHAPEKVYEIMDKTVAQSTRAANIIRRLRQSIEKTDTQLCRVDPSAFVEEASTLALVDASEKGIDVRYDLGQDLPEVLIDKVQVQQVIVNLIRNSIDALAGMQRRELTIATLASEGDLIVTTVTDTGSGLSDEVRENLFKPFTTTKSDGMGVGLSICKSIIDEHDGRLWTTSGADGETTFHFSLPTAGDTRNDV